MCPVPAVLADVPCRLNFSSHIAEMAVAMTGMYSGLHPAMIALMATFSAVISRLRVGMVPSTSPGPRPMASRNRATMSGVGGTTGRPSVSPCSK